MLLAGARIAIRTRISFAWLFIAGLSRRYTCASYTNAADNGRRRVFLSHVIAFGALAYSLIVTHAIHCDSALCKILQRYLEIATM